MKLIAFSAVIFLTLLFTVNVEADESELLIMVDISESMFPFFDDLVDYLIKDLLLENLQDDDYFHLLSFADEPQVEIAAVIDDNSSLELAVSAILLLQPMGKYTDLILAVQFLYEYVSALPADSTKSIFLLTDGIHDPPPESPFYNWDEERSRNELLKNATEIKKEGWSVHIIHLPGEAGDTAKTGESKGTDLFPDLVEALETPVIPFKQEDKQEDTQTSPSLSEPAPVMRCRFIIYILYTLLALLLVYFLIRFIRFLAVNIRLSPLFAPGLYISECYIRGSDLLVMHIYYHDWLMHNHSIKSVAPGVSKSVGGRGSAFSVQVIDLPKKIAFIHNDKGNYILKVKKEKYFPGLADPLTDCLNRKIEVVSKKNKKIFLIFERYISPLEEINNLMRSIRRS